MEANLIILKLTVIISGGTWGPSLGESVSNLKQISWIFISHVRMFFSVTESNSLWQSSLQTQTNKVNFGKALEFSIEA